MKRNFGGSGGPKVARMIFVSRLGWWLAIGLVAALWTGSVPVHGQDSIYAFTNFAGLPGTSGSADGTGTVARFNRVNGITIDGSGNLYVADGDNNTLRKLTATGMVMTMAGLAGSTGSADGTNSTARFYNPIHVAVDGVGNVYVAEFYNHTIRKLTPVGTNWVVTTLAGSAGVSGSADGTNSVARFNSPYGIVMDSEGNLIVSDHFNHTIRKLAPVGTNWVVTTLVGSAGTSGSADGTNSVARFNRPNGVALDSAGNVYMVDEMNHTVRKLTPVGTNWVVTTLAGSAGASGSVDGTNSVARFSYPNGVLVDGSGNVYVTDYGNHTVRKLTPVGPNWVVTTIGGSAGISGAADGAGSAARFNGPACLVMDSAGALYVTDHDNHRVTKGALMALLTSPTALASTNVTLNSFYANWSAVSGATNYLLDVSSVSNFASYVIGFSNLSVGAVTAYRVSNLNAGATYYYRVREQQGGLTSANSATVTVTTVSASVSVASGPGSGGNTLTISAIGLGNGSDIASVTICGISAAIQGQTADSVTVIVGAGGSGTGDIVVNSLSEGVTRLANGYNYYPPYIYAFTNFAGLPGASGSSDGTGTVARFISPSGVVADNAGNVFVADYSIHTVRKLSAAGVVTTIAGVANGSGTANGTGTVARFYHPQGLAMDRAGNMYVADRGNHSIRKLSPTGTSWMVTTIAGTSGSLGTADGSNGVARFNSPTGVAVDGAGNLFVADDQNHTIRKITLVGTNWVVTTIAGSAGSSGSADGTNGTARFYYPASVAVDGSGNVLVTDQYNNTLRKLTPVGTNWVVTTLAGSAGVSGSADGTNGSARFNNPCGVVVDNAGNAFVMDQSNSTLRRVTPGGVVTTVAGTAGGAGSADGLGSAARFNMPSYLAQDGAGSFFISDGGNYRISKGTAAELLQTPTALAAWSITPNSFQPTWSAVSGATNYLLDVSSSSNFASYVSGYSNLTVGNVTTCQVSGLNAGALYYYRARSQQNGYTSYNSTTASVTTVSVGVSVTNGPGAGGNTITVSGVGLGNGSDITNVTICGITAAIQSQTADSVTVLVGAGGGGSGSIQVYSISRGVTTLPSAYIYNPQGRIAEAMLNWSGVSNLPVALNTHAAVAVSNTIYVIGGQSAGWNPSSAVYVFDTSNPGMGWRSTNSLPVTRRYIAGAASGTKLYAIGGGNVTEASDTVFVFDTQNPASGWGSISNLPALRNCAAAATVNGKIYVTGGSDRSGVWQSSAWVYDPAQPTLGWLSVSNMPTARRFHTMTELGGKLYVVGGADNAQVPQSTAWVYDPAQPTQGWLSISNLPAPRAQQLAVPWNGKLLILCGSDGVTYATTNYLYDPSNPTQGWVPASTCPNPSVSAAATVVAGQIYVISGYSTNGFSANVYAGDISSGVSPASGSQAGGEALTITGSNLGNHDVTGVTLCGVAATVVVDNSPTQLVVTTGATSAPGTGDVVVISTSYGTTIGSNLFTYLVSLVAEANPVSGGKVSGSGSYVAGSNVQLGATASNNWLFSGWADGETNAARTVSVPATNVTYTARFVPTAVVTVESGVGSGGTVSGSGTFVVGSNTQITATASNGWWFIAWNDGVTNNPRDIVVASNVIYTATFAPFALVATLVLPAEGGTTAGDGAYLIGSNAVVTAVASNGWVFMSWNGSITNNPWEFVVPPNDLICTANFSTVSTVTVLANPTNGGSVVGAGSFLSSTNIVLAATASNNWIFTAWNDGNTNNPRTITVPVTNITYTANFSPTARISVSIGTNGGGTVTGSGSFIVGNTVQITATASNNWGFLGWSDGSTNNPRNIVVGAGGASYLANFAPIVTLATLASPPEAGVTAGDGVYFVGSNALLTATPSNGWSFLRWNDGNTQSVRTVVAPATNIIYTASFVYPAVVTVQAVPSGGGRVNGGGLFWAGTSVVISATASNGWVFAGWGDGSTQAVRSITVPRSNITYVASFGYSSSLITQANPAGGGTVTGSGVFLNGAEVSITATPQAGWVFLGWSDGFTNTPRTVTLATGVNRYTANFGSPARVGAAVNQPGMTWTLGGTSGWFDQTASSRDGSAAQSGLLSAGQMSYFQTTTNGPGSLLFWWKVSSAVSNQLQFYIGTQLVNQISGNVGWNQYVTFIGSTNPVTLTWAYAKNNAAVSGSDAGWVDQIAWLPCPFATNVPQLFFQEPAGLVASWVLNAGGGFEFSRILANTGGWVLKTAGDIDGDGVSDLLFQSPAGDTGGWFLNPDGSVRDARFWFNIGGWEIRACGDYEGLGRGQVFFQTAAGLAAYWRLDTNGAFLASVGLGSMGGWKLRGAGDLDGDHKAELFWQNTGGVVAIWYHNPDGSIRGAIPFGTGEWALSAIADVDHDGVSDLIWQTPDTRTGGWFMNSNGTVRSASFWWPTGGWKLKAAGR